MTSAADYETASEYALTISVTDNGPPAPQVTTGILTITVSNLDEAGTVTLTGPASAEEGASLLYTALATDPDADAVIRGGASVA